MITTEALVREACPKVADIGPGFYFTPETIAVGKEHGLDGFRFYFLGRGGVLGDVESDVVTSAFGYFNPALVAKIWTSARERTQLTPRAAGSLYMRCSQDFGREHLSGVTGLDAFCAAASAVNDAANRAGLPLYAGTAAEPLAEDLPARAMQLNTVLREFRGSAHLAAIVATPGITPKLAHAIKRPAFWSFFGYDDNDRPQGTEAERAALAAAEELTDRFVSPAYDVLDQAQRSALLDGLTAIQAAIPARERPGQES